MLRGGELVHIDFEMGRLRRNIEVSAAVELFKFLRWAAGDMGSAMIGEVARIAVVEYASLREMIERHVRRVLSRPFGRRRHAAAAGSADVSVMAVAEALREAFSESR